jgi:hypothetical protein
VLTSRDPTGGLTAWQGIGVDNAVNDACVGRPDKHQACPATISGLACVSNSLCVAVDEAGDEVVSSDPDADSATWRVHQLFDDGHVDLLASLACPSPRLCLSIDSSRGQLLISANPSARESWSQALTTSANSVIGASAPRCVISDPPDPLPMNLLSTNPTVGNWGTLGFRDMAQVTGASCLHPGLCLLTDSEGRTVLARLKDATSRKDNRSSPSIKVLSERRGQRLRVPLSQGQDAQQHSYCDAILGVALGDWHGRRQPRCSRRRLATARDR